MSTVQPFLTCSLTTVPFAYGYLNAPPYVITTLASDLFCSATGIINDGNFLRPLGAILAPSTATTDTYLSTTTTGRTGRSFVLNSGAATDLWKEPQNDAWGILCRDGSSGASFELTATTVGSVIEDAVFTIWRGDIPPGSGATSSNTFVRMELSYGSTRTYSILMAYDSPICLDWSDDGGTTWNTVAQLSGYGHIENYSGNNKPFQIHITANYDNNLLCIYLSDGGTLVHSPTDGSGLPVVGCKRITGKNGWLGFTYQPRIYGTGQVSRTNDLRYAHPQAANAWLSCGTLSQQTGQTYTNSVTSSGTSFQWTSSWSNSDDTVGSQWTDGQLIIPADWQTGVPGGVNSTLTVNLAIEGMNVIEDLDDNARTFTRDGSVLINNYKHQYSQSVGNFACNLSSGTNNGSTMFRRIAGIAGVGDEGIALDNPSAGENKVRFHVTDRRVTMGASRNEPIGQEYKAQFDQWCLWSFVRYQCHRGNISDAWLTKLPDVTTGTGIYVPPNAPGTYAPYGRADSSCPYPILPSGLGDNPVMEFGENMSPWDCIQAVIADMAYPYTVAGTVVGNYPLYMGFDHDGYFRCEPFAPDQVSPVYGFTDRIEQAATTYPGIIWYPLTGCTASLSISQLRSSITMIGQDWISNELLVEHRLQSTTVREAIGYYRGLVMQSERWGTDTYLSAVTGQSIHAPTVYVGDTIAVWHPNVGTTPVKYYITRLIHDVQDGVPCRQSTQFVGRYIGNY